MRLWEVKTGRLLKTWEFATSIKRVEFSPDGRQLLGVTEKRSGHLSTIVVYEINPDVEATQSDEQLLRIVCDESKATVAGFSYLAKYIISGHEDGSVTQWDGKTGELLQSNYDVHEPDMQSASFSLKAIPAC
jgi:translation initiation factor 3 subunit I